MPPLLGLPPASQALIAIECPQKPLTLLYIRHAGTVPSRKYSPRLLHTRCPRNTLLLS